jgi:ABC-type nitrate/sulfonate/bicarbonate transport system substrate-binding protein
MSKAKRYGNRRLAGAMVAIVATLISGCGSSTHNSSDSTGAGAQTTVSSGAPNLAGVSIGFAISSTSIIDTVSAELVPLILKSWGANAHVDIQSNSAIASAQAVLAGRDQVALEGPGTLIDAHLIALGPSQPRVDYVLVAQNNISSVAQLKGKTVLVSDPKGIDAVILNTELTQAGLNSGDVKTSIVASTAERASALLAGRGTATEVHIDDSIRLAGKLTSLVDAAKGLPQLADSYLGVSPSWASAHSSAAVAIDEAWLEAVKIFNTEGAIWQAAAKAYDSGNAAEVAGLYTPLLNAGLWPISPSADGFDSASLAYNQQIAVASGAANNNPSLQSWAPATYWDQAVANLPTIPTPQVSP